MIELVHASKQVKAITTSPTQYLQPAAPASPLESETSEITSAEAGPAGGRYKSQRIGYRIAQADSSLRDLYEAVRQFLLDLGDDVQIKELAFYVAFKRIKNFVCLEVYPQGKVVIAWLKVDPATVSLEEGFTRDVTNIGHFGTGDLQISMRTLEDFTKAQPLFVRSYEGS